MFDDTLFYQVIILKPPLKVNKSPLHSKSPNLTLLFAYFRLNLQIQKGQIQIYLIKSSYVTKKSSIIWEMIIFA